MTPDEVLEAVKKISDLELTRMTLTTYENAELVSRPERGGGGRGIGRWTNYSETAVAEVVAAYVMINGKYFDLTNKNPPRLDPGIVLAARLRAITDYKHRHEAHARFDKEEHEEMELLLPWLSTANEIPDEKFGHQHKNLIMAEAWIKLIDGYAMIWEYVYRNAWQKWKACI